MASRKLTHVVLGFVVTSFVGAVVHPDGVSKVSRYQDDAGNFEFGYSVASQDGEHFHKASKDALGRVVGSYGLTQLDGRHRIVDYVADEKGFRAHVRSNEPGLADSKSTDVIVDKSPDTILAHGLDFAATGDSKSNYGDRLRDISSSVTYTRPQEDETHRKNRRPVFAEVDRSPQNHRISIARPVVIESQQNTSPNIPDHRPALRNPEITSPSRYQPPIDPYSAVRRPAIPPSFQPVGRYPSGQIPQPSTPPYGGIETRNPLLDPASFGAYSPVTRNIPRNIPTRYPVVTMSSIHGGVGGMPFLLNPLLPRIPSVIQSNYPHASPNFRRYPPPVSANRPLNPSRNPNLVLRAIAIPNGIRAVHVDPATGEIYNTPEELIRVPYNNEFDDDEDDENENVDDFPYLNNRFLRSQFPINRALVNRSPNIPRINTATNRNYSSSSNSYSHSDNNGYPIEASLSKPSAKDLYLISRVFDEVNQQENARHPRLGSPSRNLPPLHESRPDYPREAIYNAENTNSEFDLGNSRGEFPPRMPLNRQVPRSRYSEIDEQPYESIKSVIAVADPGKETTDPSTP